MCQWRAIQAFLEEPGPFIYVTIRTTFRPVNLS